MSVGGAQDGTLYCRVAEVTDYIAAFLPYELQSHVLTS